MADTTFVSWQRRGGHAIGSVPVGGRASGHLTLTASDSAGGMASPPPLPFLLYGPGDVDGLRPGAVTGRYPRPGQADAEMEHCPYVELAEPDLPWRYSPRGDDGGMQPWLALLAVKPSEAERVGGAVLVTPAALSAHGMSDARAHVQQTGDHEVGRVLCLRPLELGTDYLALVVPAFDENGDAWSAARPMPVYDEWTFRTTSDIGTFEDLAEALHAAAEQENFGRIAVSLGDQDDEVVHVRGALTGIHDTTDPAPPAAATARLNALLDFDPDGTGGFDVDGRRYVRPPDYGDAWLQHARDGAPAGGWVQQVNDDPTHRVVAGLGLQGGVDLQDEIAGAAADRFGATATANQRLAALSSGLAVARSLWDRRVAPLSPERRIRVLGLAAGRVLVTDPAGAGVRPLIELASGPDRTLPRAIFSTAARRALRPNAARLRHAQGGATDLLADANAPRRTVRRADDAPGDPRYHDGVASGDTLVADVRAALGAFHVRGRDLARGDDLVPALQAAQADVDPRFKAALQRLEVPPPPRPVGRPVDLRALDDALVRAFDPRGDSAAVARVRATIAPDDPEPLAPREPCPDLDLPAWRYLRDRQREWLLPGAHLLTDGEVVGLAANPVFVDALLVGLNTQALGELRWRNIGVASGCTPLRRFWDRSTNDAAYAVDFDIRGIAQWVGPDGGGGDRRAVPLGSPAHTPGGTDARQLVVVFCTDLFRRYPGTLVYLAPPTGPGPDAPPNGQWADADLTRRVLPAFTARVTAKLVLYAFPCPPEALEQFWVVVEQQPPGTRFKRALDPGPGSTSAARAAKMLHTPVRVLLAGPTLVGGAR
jgi:hypothetical protein